MIFLVPILIFLCILNSVPGYGQEIFSFEEIVVSATKMEERRSEVPNAVIIKKSEDIAISPSKSVGELLSNEPGIEWHTFGNYGGAAEQIRIRGVPAAGTQVFLNGVNINSPSLGITDFSKVPIENIERIEVIKGSGSLLYGSGAVGGVINIFTKEPKREKVEIDLKAGYGTQNTYTAYFQHGRFVNETFGYYITAGRKETDGFRANSFLRENDVSLKLIFDKGEPFKLSLYSDYIDNAHGLPGVKPPKGTQEYWEGGKMLYNEEAASLLDRGEDRDLNFVLDLKGSPMEGFRYNIKGFFRNMNNYYYGRYPLWGGDETWTINRTSGVEGNLSFENHRLKVLFGGEYKSIRWKNAGYQLDQQGLRTAWQRNVANIYTGGLFSEVGVKVTSLVRLLGGIRLEHHSTFGEEFVPLFGAVFNPKENIAVKLTHGRHFRAPTPNDLFWPATGWTRGNPELKPEIGWHSDITYEQTFLQNKASISASYFRWRIDRKIMWQPDPNWVWTPMNLKDYGADGFEIGLRFHPKDPFFLSLNYTYVDAYERAPITLEKRAATLTPKNTLRADITFRRSDIEGMLIGKYVARRVGLYRGGKTYELPSYWTLDARLRKSFFKNFILTLDAKNILDKKYYTALGSFTDATTWKTTVCGYPASGRSIFLSVSYEK